MRGARTSGNGGRKWINGLVQLQSSWQQCSILLSAVDCGNSPSEQRVCILEPRYEPGLRECRVGEGAVLSIRELDAGFAVTSLTSLLPRASLFQALYIHYWVLPAAQQDFGIIPFHS